MEQFNNRFSYFPQIYRIIPANTIIIVAKVVVLVVVTTFLALNLFIQLPPRFTKTRQVQLAVMLMPNDLSNHLLLAQEYLGQGNMPAVERELILSQDLSSLPTTHNPSPSVLGLTLSPLKILEKIKNEPQKIREEISFWEKVVAQKPDFRDAYLQLALLNYQIYNLDKAKEYLQEAKKIDPNFKATKELEKILIN